MTARDYVRRGITVLDQAKPNWWKKIAVSRLNLGRCDVCILGQLYGGKGEEGYDDGLEELRRLHDAGKLKLPRGSFADGDVYAYELGFDANGATYEDLTRIWADEIAKRRKAARATDFPRPPV